MHADHTFWFGYTTGATAEILTLRVKNPDIPTVLAVYTGSPGAFRLAPGACAVAGSLSNNAQLAGNSIRITVGRFNTEEEIDFALAYLKRKIAACRDALAGQPALA